MTTRFCVETEVDGYVKRFYVDTRAEATKLMVDFSSAFFGSPHRAIISEVERVRV